MSFRNPTIYELYGTDNYVIQEIKIEKAEKNIKTHLFKF